MRNVLIAAAVLLSCAAHAGEARFTWEASARAAGYKLKVGVTPGTYTVTTIIDDGTEFVYSTLTDGCVKHVAAVSAYNTAGESANTYEVGFMARPIIVDVPPFDSDGDGVVDTWLVNGGNFGPDLTVTIDGNDIPFGHSASAPCEQLTIPVVSIPVQPTYATLEVCTPTTRDDDPTDGNGPVPLNKICGLFLLTPSTPGGFDVQ